MTIAKCSHCEGEDLECFDCGTCRGDALEQELKLRDTSIPNHGAGYRIGSIWMRTLYIDRKQRFDTTPDWGDYRDAIADAYVAGWKRGLETIQEDKKMKTVKCTHCGCTRLVQYYSGTLYGVFGEMDAFGYPDIIENLEPDYNELLKYTCFECGKEVNLEECIQEEE